MAKAGDFESRWKARACPARRKIAGRRHCRTGRLVGPIALSKARARVFPGARTVRQRGATTRRRFAPFPDYPAGVKNRLRSPGAR